MTRVVAELFDHPSEDATLDREAVTLAVRSAGNGKMPAAAPPNFGQMSDQEFTAYKRGFGF